MRTATPSLPTTAEAFLAWDATQTLRREFAGGRLVEREAADDRHATVVGNLCIAVRGHLRGAPCRTFSASVKLRVRAADAVFYPDVFVTCSAADTDRATVKEDAILVVEVLSSGTAAYDHGEKFSACRKLPTLAEYVLVDVDTRRTDVYRKGSDGLWVLHPFEGEQAVRLASVGLDIAAADLFAEVEPAPAARSSRPSSAE